MDFNNEFDRRKESVNEIISRFLPKEEGLQKTVTEAMNYSVSVGGKRLRPMLMQETYKLFGGTGAVVEPFMAAMEMIHTYSLVHDDLPAMDNDEYRRGKKTTHSVYGEAMGILAGDALLNYAYETALQAFDIDSGATTVQAMRILSRKAGIYGMVGGQTVDIESEGKPISMSTVEFIHRLKCGALIESSMLIGAVLAGADDNGRKVIERVSSNIGLAFQIQDDILDVTGTNDILGKSVGNDVKNGKTTYVTLKGLDASKKEVEALSDEAVSLLKSVTVQNEHNEFLQELIRSLTIRRM